MRLFVCLFVLNVVLVTFQNYNAGFPCSYRKLGAAAKARLVKHTRNEIAHAFFGYAEFFGYLRIGKSARNFP